MKERPLRLLILCSLGTSSFFLSRRIQACAFERGILLQIEPASVSAPRKKALDYDLVLLEPHVHHFQTELEKTITDIPIVPVDPRAFARMDGCAVLNQALKALYCS
ncbi:PTS sugar transporter subunit IIB [Salinithrix halophila]|uniref:PTS sugar transporter subunit IIB n=1 Tax=Salinithrix halophila TaxID=1485204 RepID=A0ABV8JF89_9BACL